MRILSRCACCTFPHAFGNKPTPNGIITVATRGIYYTTHHPPHLRMFVERKGPGATTPGDTKGSGWAVLKATCHLKQHKPNGTTQHVTHDLSLIHI